jgi:hypothetical protein
VSRVLLLGYDIDETWRTTLFHEKWRVKDEKEEEKKCSIKLFLYGYNALLCYSTKQSRFY